MKSQRGNILFLILLAVALFAAFNYAVTSSMRGDGKDSGSERNKILATQMIENAALIENNIQRARLVDNIPEYGFSLSGSGSNAANNATCTQTSCRIYTDRGGGVPPLIIPDWARGPANNGTSNTKATFNVSQIVNIGTSQEDVSLHYLQISRELCEALNSVLGITDINLNNTGEGYGGTWTTYYGTITAIPVSGAILGDTITAIAGKRTFCFQHSSNGYTFVHVVIPR